MMGPRRKRLRKGTMVLPVNGPFHGVPRPWRYTWLAICMARRHESTTKIRASCGYVEVVPRAMKHPYMCRLCGNRTTGWRGYVKRKRDGSLQMRREL